MSTDTATTPEITTWAERPGGGRARSFSVRGCEILVTSDDGRDAEGAHLALELAAAAVGITARWDALVAERDAAVRRSEAAERLARAAEQRVPPPAPQRLIGPACVRFRGAELWLLNKREGGWASWGVRCDGWDDLFRRYAVTITEHGTDEHGAYWIAVPEAR